MPTFPAATNARPDWGAGFQVGLFYELSDNWNLGFSYKSPIWQEKWDLQRVDSPPDPAHGSAFRPTFPRSSRGESPTRDSPTP